MVYKNKNLILIKLIKNNLKKSNLNLISLGHHLNENNFIQVYPRRFSTNVEKTLTSVFKRGEKGKVSYSGFKKPNDMLNHIHENLTLNEIKLNQDGSYSEIKVGKNLIESFQNLESLNRDQIKSIMDKLNSKDMLFQSSRITLNVIGSSKFKKLSTNLAKVIS